MIYDLSSYVGLLLLLGSFKIGHAGPCLNSYTDVQITWRKISVQKKQMGEKYTNVMIFYFIFFKKKKRKEKRKMKCIVFEETAWNATIPSKTCDGIVKKIKH